MKYTRILAAILAECWAMEPDKICAVAEFITAQVGGRKFTDAEIEAKIGGSRANAVARQAGAVAVLPVFGVISPRISLMDMLSGGGGTSLEMLNAWYDAAQENPDVKAIVLHYDTPGGVVTGVPEFGDKLFSGRGGKPVIAQVTGSAASAGYWMAASHEDVVVSPSSSVGSIGVYTMHENIARALDAEGVDMTLISAGKYKTEGHPFGPLDDEAREAMQARVNEYYDMFLSAVARGRERSVDEVREQFGQGRMVTAQRAVKLGMADRVGTLEDTIRRFGGSTAGGRSRGAQARAPTARMLRELDHL